MNKNRINKFLSRFGFEVHGTGYMQSVRKNDFKTDEFLVQKDLLRGDASVIFDVGANRGNVALKYATIFPDAEIYAFEPFADSFNIMAGKVTDRPKIHAVQKGISNESGSQKLYVNNNVDTNSVLKSRLTGLTSDDQVQNVKEIQFEAITIDDYCRTNEISTIDILKMDIQGGELAALKGAENMLSSGRIRLIYSEVYFLQQYEGQPLFHDIADYLYRFGYRLQDFYSPIYGKGSLAWCDAIFKFHNPS